MDLPTPPAAFDLDAHAARMARDGYTRLDNLLDDAALAQVRADLAPHLGGDFYVATPSRDMFLALSLNPAEFRERLCERVAEDFKRLPYPICPELFYVTRDGVAGTQGKLAA